MVVGGGVSVGWRGCLSVDLLGFVVRPYWHFIELVRRN